MKVFNEFRCPVCRQWVSKDVIAVTAETRKNKRGRIAWLRDGICPACAAKARTIKEVEENSD